MGIFGTWFNLQMENKTPPFSDPFSDELRGFGFVGIIAILLILFTGNVFIGNMIVLPVGAIIVLIWRWRSRTSWTDIGYARPGSWTRTFAIGILLGIGLKFVMKATVMPLFGADPVNQAYHFLAGNSAMMPAAIWAMIIAGFAEETVFRGYMFERLKKLAGTKKITRVIIVIFTSMVFGLGHYTTQGVTGVVHAFIVGLVYGTIVELTGKIWTVMIAHAAFNLTALAMIFWDVETYIAHLIFR